MEYELKRLEQLTDHFLQDFHQELQLVREMPGTMPLLVVPACFLLNEELAPYPTGVPMQVFAHCEVVEIGQVHENFESEKILKEIERIAKDQKIPLLILLENAKQVRGLVVPLYDTWTVQKGVA